MIQKMISTPKTLLQSFTQIQIWDNTFLLDSKHVSNAPVNLTIRSLVISALIWPQDKDKHRSSWHINRVFLPEAAFLCRACRHNVCCNPLSVCLPPLELYSDRSVIFCVCVRIYVLSFVVIVKSEWSCTETKRSWVKQTSCNQLGWKTH